MGFQAVIKSAASAASLGTQKNKKNQRKNREKMKENLPFWAFYIGNPMFGSELCLDVLVSIMKPSLLVMDSKLRRKSANMHEI